MSKKTFSNKFFTARQLARASGKSAATVRRQAWLENWPKKQHGNRLAWRVPLAWMRQNCQDIGPDCSLRAILDKTETIRALDRAAAVLGFIREMKRDPKCGVECALDRTVSNFRHLKDFSIRALRVWVESVAGSGLGALHEKKLGRVGRRAGQLHKILK